MWYKIAKQVLAGHTSAIVALWFDSSDAKKIAMPKSEAIEGVVPEPSDQMHITLVFLGGAAELKNKKEQICAVLEVFAEKRKPLKGKVSGTGRFFSEEGSEAYYASFDCPELNAFREELVEAMKVIGVEINAAHGFTPHISLAYLEKTAPLPEYKPPFTDVTIKKVTLAWADQHTHFKLSA